MAGDILYGYLYDLLSSVDHAGEKEGGKGIVKGSTPGSDTCDRQRLGQELH